MFLCTLLVVATHGILLRCETYRNLRHGHNSRLRDLSGCKTRNAQCSIALRNTMTITESILAPPATIRQRSTAVVVLGAAISELRTGTCEANVVLVVLIRGIGDVVLTQLQHHKFHLSRPSAAPALLAWRNCQDTHRTETGIWRRSRVPIYRRNRTASSSRPSVSLCMCTRSSHRMSRWGK
jgi:hypothetical protein